nr:septum site-determining protein Ssd [Arthrobacter zhangbolii]
MNLEHGAGHTAPPGDRYTDAGGTVSGRLTGRQGRRTLQGDGGRPAVAAVLVSGDQGVQDEVARVGAAAGVEISLAVDIGTALAMRPEVLLLDSGRLRLLPGRGGATAGSGAGTPDVIVIGLAGDTAVWDVAAYSSAARVAVLPAAAGWLAGYLGRRRNSSGGGTVLGVLGSGGAGASTTACWLAAAAVETGVSVLLLEADPWGAGLEWALDAGDLQGVRWPDLEGISGSLNPVQLAAGLPALGGFSLLARGPGLLPADEAVTGAVLDAARSGFELTIVDLGSSTGTEPLLHLCEELLLVVPGRVSGVLGARSLLLRLGSAKPHAVVRGPLGDGLDELLVANALGLPLAGYLPFLRATARSEGSGRVLADAGRPRIRRAAQRILAKVSPAPAGEVT